MNLSELKAAGGIVGGAMVKKAVVWKHKDSEGKPLVDEFFIHVMPQSFGMIEHLFSSSESEQSRNAKYISTCVTLGPNGEEVIPYEDAYRLDPGLGWAILGAVHEVNNTGADRAKN